MNQLLEMLETNPIVAAIKDEAGLEAALKSEVGIVFVLHGDLCTLPAIVERIKLKKRMAIVHVDLIEGLKKLKMEHLKSTVPFLTIMTLVLTADCVSGRTVLRSETDAERSERTRII